MIFDELTDFKQFIKDLPETRDFYKLEVWRERMDKSFEDLREITLRLEELDPKTDHCKIQRISANNYIDLLAKARKLKQPAVQNTIDNANRATDTAKSVTFQQETAAAIPKQNLPQFDGKYEDWLQFQAEFSNVIDQRTDLTDHEKFKYLVSCLQGEALQIVLRYTITNKNYAPAWNLLKRTFEGKNYIVWHHISSIVRAPEMEGASSRELKNFINKVEYHLSSLKSLGQPVVRWNTLLLYIIIDKIDTAERRKWLNSQTRTNIPKFLKFMEFLKRIADTRDNSTARSHPKEDREIEQGARVNAQKGTRRPGNVEGSSRGGPDIGDVHSSPPPKTPRFSSANSQRPNTPTNRRTMQDRDRTTRATAHDEPSCSYSTGNEFR